MKKPNIGFIGQGWIGKHYADDFEKRGYKTVRYSLEEPYINNREKVKTCDIVFIAVNHSYFTDHLSQMFDLCRKDTWFIDVWNLCQLGQIYFQKMEIYQ